MVAQFETRNNGCIIYWPEIMLAQFETRIIVKRYGPEIMILHLVGRITVKHLHVEIHARGQKFEDRNNGGLSGGQN